MPLLPTNSVDGQELTFPLYASLFAMESQARAIVDQEAVDRVQHQLEGELREAGQCLRGHTVRVAVRFGDPAVEIARFAAEEPIDLIAMATHARTGVSEMVLGSVAREVLRHAPVPVLLLRPVEQAELIGASLTEMTDAPSSAA